MKKSITWVFLRARSSRIIANEVGQVNVTPTDRAPWSQWDERQLQVLVQAMIDVTRQLARHVPPARGSFFFGLDCPEGDCAPLDGLCARGIFRKYESVLEIGSSLGGAARWLSHHFGCRISGAEPVPGLAAAAARLSTRARSGQTQFLCSEGSLLPWRGRTFTHVWCLERLPDPGAVQPQLRETLRVLRPGGHTAVQRTNAPEGWAAQVADALRAAGFIEVTENVRKRPPLPEGYRLARERLMRHLEALPQADAAALAQGVGEFYRRQSANASDVTQVFASRRSTDPGVPA